MDSIDVEMLINDIQVIPETQQTRFQAQPQIQASNNTNVIVNTPGNNLNVTPIQSGTSMTIDNSVTSIGSISNTSISLENIKSVISESLNAQNLCSKQDISEFIINKFNEFSGLFITTEMADQHIKTLEELMKTMKKF